MKKIISYSIWGNNPRYTKGAIQNAKLAQIYYPDWVCRFYVNYKIDKEIINELKQQNNTEITIVKESPNWSSTLWRFLPGSELDTSAFISRDADSRLSKREKFAVDEWINSEKSFHIIRDHQYHARPMMAGMWGCKNKKLLDIKSMINSYKKVDDYESDQKFLALYVYPKTKKDSVIHDEFFEKKPFPKKSGERIPAFHVGQAYDGEGNVLDVENYGLQSYIKYIKEHENIII